MTFCVPEKYRIKGLSNETFGNNGAFKIPGPHGRDLNVIASDVEGWEHVSVSTPKYIPTWLEMCFIKNLFWGDEDMVIQFHPPKSEYVNNCDTCLHLWRPIDKEIPRPKKELV